MLVLHQCRGVLQVLADHACKPSTLHVLFAALLRFAATLKVAGWLLVNHFHRAARRAVHWQHLGSAGLGLGLLGSCLLSTNALSTLALQIALFVRARVTLSPTRVAQTLPCHQAVHCSC